jgi:hypothetical protein
MYLTHPTLRSIDNKPLHRTKSRDRLRLGSYSLFVPLYPWKNLNCTQTRRPDLIQSNLPSGVTESTLGMFFAKIGPIATVKIMWRELFIIVLISS